MVWQQEVAHQMVLVPVATALVLGMRGTPRDDGWWWILAGVVGVSWCADTSADLLPTSWSWVPSLVYPAPQAVLVARVFLRRAETLVFALLLTIGAVVAARLHQAHGPDYLFRAFAWFGMLAASWAAGQRGRLFIALVIYFGCGWAAWLAFALHPVVPRWYIYQSTQLVGLVWLSVALGSARAPLRLVT